MARVLSGTAPQITAQDQVDTSAATGWIQAHYDDFRGQWVAVRLDQPSLVASASTLRHLFESVPGDELDACLVQYVYTLEQEQVIPGPWWQG